MKKKYLFRDSSFSRMLELKKYKSLYDVSSLEVISAILATLIFLILFPIVSNCGEKIIVLERLVDFYDSIGMAMIGFLGVIIAGLAISIALISNKVFNYIKENNHLNAIESLLYGFYLLGFITAVQIMIMFILHVVSMMDMPITRTIFFIDEAIGAILVYLFIFSMFYTVKLIGVGLQLFEILNEMENKLQ